MSDNPQARRRTLLWHSFMPCEPDKSPDKLDTLRVQAGQTLRLHTAHCSSGDYSHCWAPWPCDAALWSALVLELAG